MKLSRPNFPPCARRPLGSVLIIVLWVAFGLVAVALYLAQTTSLELRAADQRVAALEAEQALASAALYVSNLLASLPAPGLVPDPELYAFEAVPVGTASFSFLGRADTTLPRDQAAFGLIDEAAKLNLNTATAEMLEPLPRMTPELAAAIIDWRDANTTPTTGGAETDLYQRLTPAYRCKDGPFESVDELRLVYGTSLDLLLGEDANLNGVLDPNENDGTLSLPYDNRDGRLDPGLFEYLTVYSREPNLRTNGSPRVNVNSASQTNLADLLLEKGFSTDRANQILQNLGLAPVGAGSPGTGPGTGQGGGRGGTGSGGTGTGGAGSTPTSLNLSSVLEFYIRSGMSADEFAQIEADITVSTNQVQEGLINLNTAPAAVLACVPGIGPEHAASVVAYRQNRRASLLANPTVAWLVDVIGQTNAVQAGPYLTAHSYQFTADVVALGHHGRGLRRVRLVFDTSEGLPRIVYRQDLTHLGWPLGAEVRRQLRLAQDRR